LAKQKSLRSVSYSVYTLDFVGAKEEAVTVVIALVDLNVVPEGWVVGRMEVAII